MIRTSAVTLELLVVLQSAIGREPAPQPGARDVGRIDPVTLDSKHYSVELHAMKEMR